MAQTVTTLMALINKLLGILEQEAFLVEFLVYFSVNSLLHLWREMLLPVAHFALVKK